VVKQYSENQYDDDLTVGTDDYDDSYYTGSVDLFEFSNDEESPISRLKSLILSIDWEITDEILMQFNEELVELRDIWAGDKINLVYVQALEKISKYIYQKKADSHPSAIKLLLTLYHNLERIVSSVDLTDEQKKEILLEDVKRFESLKYHIGKPSETVDETHISQPIILKHAEKTYSENDLLNLKAIVLGIDWEITDQDLNKLRQEVIRLEEKFADSRPKLILLQGIGTLGAYIKLKKSNSHADAFKLLHLFYENLEKIVVTPMDLEEEKAILFPVVKKFNSFKTLLGATIAPEAINRDKTESDEDVSLVDSGAIAPAFADLPEEEIIGFQAEEEAKSLGSESSGSVNSHIENFFMDDSFLQPEEATYTTGSDAASGEIPEIALQGVDMEADYKDEVYEGVPSESEIIIPALSLVSEEQGDIESLSPALLGEDLAEDEELFALTDNISLPDEEVKETFGDSQLLSEDKGNTELDFSKLDKDLVLQGVAVESEADDDSDEEALPMMDGELAPALAENDEVSVFNAELFENSAEVQNVDDEIEGTLGGFFDEEIESHFAAVTKVDDDHLEVTSTTIDSAEVETEFEGDGDSLAPFDVEHSAFEDLAEEDIGEDAGLTLFADDEQFVPEGTSEELMGVDQEGIASEVETEIEELEDVEDVEDAIAFVSELEHEESLDSFFGDNDLEQSTEDSLGEGQKEYATEFEQRLDSFFDLEESVEEPEEQLVFVLPEEQAEDIATIDAESVEEPEEQLVFVLPEEQVEDIATTVAEDVVTPVADDFEEDEVIFELVEEEHQLSDIESGIGKGEETSFDGLLTGESDISSPVLASEDDNEIVEELIENVATSLEADKAVDTYTSLRTCVESLGLELDDKVISGLWKEMDSLQQSMVNKPLEKTFLQLLSTIARHIDKNRYDSSTDAYVLLQSVCNALTALQQDDLNQNQELLLSETQKVLKWQEDLLAEQVARKEAELTIGDSILTFQDGGSGDLDDDFEDLKDGVELQDIATGGVDGKVSDQNEFAEPTKLNEPQERHAAEGATKTLTDDLKQEISTLRKTLQEEIDELRREFKGNYP
jgi:pilus assembly protein FimV